jgi:hypothetical protein
MAVNLVTIHHEGAGSPSDNVGRFSEGGYCYGIGVTLYQRFRAPVDNWATLNFNGQDLTICLSGNRMDYPVTDSDIPLIHGAFMDCYNRGEVTSAPQVRAHRNSPGSSTVCPGDQTMARWNDVANACRVDTPTPPTPKPPEDDKVTDLASAINHDGRPVVVQVGGDKKLYYRIRDAEGGNWRTWQDLSGGFTNFETVTAFVNPKNKAINVWVTMKDGKSFQRWQNEPDFATWSSWTDMTR